MYGFCVYFKQPYLLNGVAGRYMVWVSPILICFSPCVAAAAAGYNELYKAGECDAETGQQRARAMLSSLHKMRARAKTVLCVLFFILIFWLCCWLEETHIYVCCAVASIRLTSFRYFLLNQTHAQIECWVCGAYGGRHVGYLYIEFSFQNKNNKKKHSAHGRWILFDVYVQLTIYTRIYTI